MLRVIGPPESGDSHQARVELRRSVGLDTRRDVGPFIAFAQTKNESGAVVADLLLGEIGRLSSAPPADLELTPRKAVLIGGSRNLETANGLGQIASLALYGMGLDDQSLHQQRAGDHDADAEVCGHAARCENEVISSLSVTQRRFP